MKQFGNRTGGRNLNRFQSGNYSLQDADIPEDQWIKYKDFSGGYDSMLARESIGANESPSCLNMMVSDKNRLVRLPGTTLFETLDQAATQVALHASLSNRSELVFFAAPYFGYKSSGLTTWFDAGLSASGPFGYANYGGTFIFSNGIKVYGREPDQEDLTELDKTKAVVAHTYASFAGRIFGGHAIIAGNMEPMGIAWNGSDADALDHSGPDSGFELLIDEMSSADRIMKLVPMGLDFMAILCRKSIWLGRRTGISARPSDFQTRVAGVGNISATTAHPTEKGVLFLSDDGVRLFDGNNAPVVSTKINGDLLPLDIDNLDKYSASFNPFTKLYYLHTPTNTWIYELSHDRWFKSSLITRGGVVFPTQFARKRWSDLVGTWAMQTGTWADFAPYEGNDINQLFLSSDGLRIDSEDMDSENYFGVAMESPEWLLKAEEGTNHRDLKYLRQRVELLRDMQIPARSLGSFLVEQS